MFSFKYHKNGNNSQNICADMTKELVSNGRAQIFHLSSISIRFICIELDIIFFKKTLILRSIFGQKQPFGIHKHFRFWLEKFEKSLGRNGSMCKHSSSTTSKHYSFLMINTIIMVQSKFCSVPRALIYKVLSEFSYLYKH